MEKFCIVLFAFLAMACNPLKMEVIEQEDRGSHICQLVEYNVSKQERVRSFLLVPKGAETADKLPGLVLLHDHGARFDIGKEKLVKPLASAPEHTKLSSQQWIDDNFDGVFFGDSLAALGYVVIVPDMLYWGGRSTDVAQEWAKLNFCGGEGDIKLLKNQVYEGQRAVYDSLAAQNIIWAEQTINEDAVAAEVLMSLPYVDDDRIGCFGWSMGAHRAWLLTAFCEHIRTGVALCWMTLKETVKQPLKASDYSMLIPHLRDNYDFPDIAQALAPKPFYFLNGTQDKLFPLWSVEKSFEIMQGIYDEKGATGKLKTELFDGPHHCGKDVQARIVDYLSDQLSADVQE